MRRGTLLAAGVVCLATACGRRSALLLIESNGQTWTWTGSDWRLRPTVGHPRGEVLAAATDRTRREVVLLVGSAAGEVTWTLREDRWTSHGRAP